MSEKSQISKMAEDLIHGLSSLDGKIIGGDLQKSKLRLAKDDKAAVINDIADKYLKKNLTNDILAKAKEEYRITAKDIIRELAKRQIETALGI